METTILPLSFTANPTRERNALAARLENSDIFRDYQRSFQVLTGLPLALRAAGSFQLSMQGQEHGNAFCRLLATRNKTCAACLNVQERLEKTACDRASTLACFAGLYESAVPILVGDKIIAYLRTGQVLFHAPTDAETRKASREASDLDSSLDRSTLEETYRQSRVMGRNQYDSLLRLLEIFARQLSALSNELMITQNSSEEPAVSRARAFITEHITEDLSLAQVSRSVGMSSFYFCKKFREVTGLTFTEYVSRSRVEAVKQLLLNPYKRVSEAAYEAGFQSLSQFNRMFYRIVGEQPSAYRDKLHNTRPATGCRTGRLMAA